MGVGPLCVPLDRLLGTARDGESLGDRGQTRLVREVALEDRPEQVVLLGTGCVVIIGVYVLLKTDMNMLKKLASILAFTAGNLFLQISLIDINRAPRNIIVKILCFPGYELNQLVFKACS